MSKLKKNYFFLSLLSFFLLPFPSFHFPGSVVSPRKSCLRIVGAGAETGADAGEEAGAGDGAGAGAGIEAGAGAGCGVLSVGQGSLPVLVVCMLIMGRKEELEEKDRIAAWFDVTSKVFNLCNQSCFYNPFAEVNNQTRRNWFLLQ